MSSPDDFCALPGGEKCVICGKGDWCRRSASGGHECHRIHADTGVNGYKLVANTSEGYGVFRHHDDRRDSGGNFNGFRLVGNQPVFQADFAADAKRFEQALTHDRMERLAEQLGVSPAALEAIRAGRASQHDLRRLGASGHDWQHRYPPGAYSFPEQDATGAFLGICLRADDGRKGFPSGKVGAKRGLILPTTLAVRMDPVLLVEGPTDVAACETPGIASVGRPSNSSGGRLIAHLLTGREVLVVGENDKNPAGVWPGRDGAEKLAKYLSTKWKRAVSWTLPPEGHKDVRAYLQNLIANGLDVNDEAACHEAGKALVESLLAAATVEHPPEPPEVGAGGRGGGGDNAARDRILQLCEEAGDHFFHDNESRAYVLVQEGGVARTLQVKSRAYKLLIARRYYKETKSGLPTAAKSEAIATLEGFALYDGPEEPVFIRCGQYEDKIVLDLCDEAWRVVVIDKQGWRVVSNSPIRFRRASGMLALPAPLPGGKIGDLRTFINVGSDEDFILICGFILACLNPNGPFMVLMVNGEAGSAKSTLCRIIRALIDPNKAPLRSEPKDNRDLAIAANNSWMAALDNMTSISERLSNALCRLATGGGFSTRELYSDDEEVIFDAKRPVLINGIGEITDRSDLIDRSVRITLPTIPEGQRRTEAEVWAEFETKRAAILGALLDAVSAALRNQASVRFDRLPRMADSTHWVVAAEPACPWPPGSFVGALDEQRREADEYVIEASLVASTVREWVQKNGGLHGSATQIWETLSRDKDERFLKRRDWPKSAPAFGTKLREAAPNLRRVGIEVQFDRSGAGRNITIYPADKPPESLSLLSPPSQPGFDDASAATNGDQDS